VAIEIGPPQTQEKRRRLLRWEFPLLKKLSERPTLIFNKPPIHEIFEQLLTTDKEGE